MDKNSLKICTKCHTSKPLEDFPKDSKGKLGRRADCKVCNCLTSKAYQKANLGAVLAKNRRWVEANKEHVTKYRSSRLPIDREQAQKRYWSNPTVREERIKNSFDYRSNPAHKETIRETKRKWRAAAFAKKPILRVIANLRRRLIFVLNGERKQARSMELVGCSTEQLRVHLESLFQSGMSWENYGKGGWVIDHVIPCESFNLSKEQDQRKCFHYTNLQPLWEKDNLTKGKKISPT